MRKPLVYRNNEGSSCPLSRSSDLQLSCVTRVDLQGASLQHVEGPGNHAEQAVQCARAHVRLLANGDQIPLVLRGPRADQRVEADDHETVVVGELSSIAVQAARNEPSFVFSHKFRMVPQNFRLLQFIPVPFGCSNIASDRSFPPARPITEQRSEPIITEQWVKPVARCGRNARPREPRGAARIPKLRL